MRETLVNTRKPGSTALCAAGSQQFLKNRKRSPKAVVLRVFPAVNVEIVSLRAYSILNPSRCAGLQKGFRLRVRRKRDLGCGGGGMHVSNPCGPSWFDLEWGFVVISVRFSPTGRSPIPGGGRRNVVCLASNLLAFLCGQPSVQFCRNLNPCVCTCDPSNPDFPKGTHSYLL